MSEVKWIKITTNMFDDEKIQLIECLPSGDVIVVIWLKILTLAGKQNNGGLIMLSDKIPYTDEMLSVIFKRKIPMIRLAIDTFISFDMIEILDNNGILINNWEKHQELDKLIAIKEKTNLRVKKHREKKKQELLECNVTETFRNATDKIRLDKIRLDKNKEEEKKEAIPFSNIQKLWNSIDDLSSIKSISESRKKHIKARIKDTTLEDFYEVIENVKQSKFLTGDNNRDWKCTFDWIINATNYSKILEGNYKNKVNKTNTYISDNSLNLPE